MSAQSTGSGWFVAGLLFVNILIAITGMNALAPLFPEVSTEIALSMAQMGTAIGVFNLASPIFTPIGGAIADRFGCRWTLGVTTMILGVGACMRFFADTPGELIAYMFLLGVGFAPYGPLVPKALSGYFPPEELGKANGVVFSSFGLGGALALGTAASFMSPAFGGWRQTMMVLGLLSLAGGIAWMVLYRDPPKQAAAEATGSVLDNFKLILSLRDIWLLSVSYAFCMFGVWTILSLLPTIFDERGISKELVSVMMFTSVAFNILGGVLSDKLGRRKPMIVGCAICLGLSIPGMLLTSGVPLIVCLIIAGIGFGPLLPVATAIPVEMKAVGPGLAGTAVGVMFMIGNTGGFLGPVIAGKLIDTFGTPWAGFGFVSVAAFVGAFVAMGMQETGRAARTD